MNFVTIIPVLIENGIISLIVNKRKKEPMKGRHQTPGGKKESKDHTEVNAAQREFHEETGIDIHTECNNKENNLGSLKFYKEIT